MREEDAIYSPDEYYKMFQEFNQLIISLKDEVAVPEFKTALPTHLSKKPIPMKIQENKLVLISKTRSDNLPGVSRGSLQDQDQRPTAFTNTSKTLTEAVAVVFGDVPFNPL